MEDLAPRPGDLEPIETASRDELAAPATRAAALVARATPMRTRRSIAPTFDAAGVQPVGSATLADLAKFPFTTKSDLRDAYPFGMFAVPREKIVRLHASSGTTGKPTVVGYTKRDIETWSRSRRPLDSRIRRPGGRYRACRLRLRPVHRGLGRALRRRAARLHGRADLRRE